MSVSHIREISEITPLVLVNRIVEGIPCVYTDSRAAMKELVDDLVALGHRRIAYLPGPTRSWANTQRSRAVAERARAREVELVRLPATSARHADGIGAAPAVVECGATAVMAFDDVLASGLVEGLRRLGLSVPGDISLTGHDDVLAEIVQPGLTTVTGESARVGQLAIDRLLEEASAESATKPEAVPVRAYVVRRFSTAAPARRATTGAP
jgi:LacI family transcriptional regulator